MRFELEGSGQHQEACVLGEAAGLLAAFWDQGAGTVMARRSIDATWWAFPTSGEPERQQQVLLGDDIPAPWWVGEIYKQAIEIRESEQ